MYEFDEVGIIYMGDDLFDYEVMCCVGFFCCLVNVVYEIKVIVQYIFFMEGGVGCVWDVIEKVMCFNENWDIEIQLIDLFGWSD